MARQEHVSVTCDYPHSEDRGEAETITFGYDGKSYEIDACREHAISIRRQMTQLVERARPVSGRRPPRKRNTAARQLAAEKRDWARRNGFAVNDRGRLPDEAEKAWREQHRQSAA